MRIVGYVCLLAYKREGRYLLLGMVQTDFLKGVESPLLVLSPCDMIVAFLANGGDDIFDFG